MQAQRDVGFDLLWLLNAAAFSVQEGRPDMLERLYTLADAKAMKVIIDLPQGGWYGKASADDVIAAVTEAVRDLHRRYGRHTSFYGWYLNYEINPIRPGDTAETAYWRRVWKAISEECHRVAPGSVVTISPFFLLDDTSRRGFIYLTPQQYAEWWGATLKETGIDVIMLQDSGEHLAFFAPGAARNRSGRPLPKRPATREQFWLNVETGEADVRSWEEYLPLEAQRKVPWRFTPIEWLEQKLRLAAKHADHIINWGYFPFMDPHLAEAGGGAVPRRARRPPRHAPRMRPIRSTITASRKKRRPVKCVGMCRTSSGSTARFTNNCPVGCRCGFASSPAWCTVATRYACRWDSIKGDWYILPGRRRSLEKSVVSPADRVGGYSCPICPGLGDKCTSPLFADFRKDRSTSK